MRILIVADTYYPHVNGASYFAQRLAEYLKARGHEIAVIAPSENIHNTDKIVDGVRVFGISSLPVFFYSGFRFSLPLIIKSAIKRAFEEFRPEIVHLQSHFTIDRAAFWIARKKGLPMVATNHFMPENLLPFLPLPKFIINWIKELAWKDFARIYKKVGVITSPTETAAHLIDVKLGIPVKAISCGIDLKRFNPKNTGEHLRALYKIPNVPILLYVGRLDKEKNLDLVIRAFRKSTDKTKVHLVIAGKGSESDNLKKLTFDLGLKEKITFTGFVTNADLASLYALSDCVISPGTAELQSISTMEGMATGKPIIAVNAMALPELVKDGENGFLYEDGDENGLSEKIVRIFSDSAMMKKMGEKSLEFIQKHDIDKVMGEYENLYQFEISRSKI
ncbi:MAG TPA: glycosyltransferase [Candidatus Paceibacterota bacterium]